MTKYRGQTPSVSKSFYFPRKFTVQFLATVFDSFFFTNIALVVVVSALLQTRVLKWITIAVIKQPTVFFTAVVFLISGWSAFSLYFSPNGTIASVLLSFVGIIAFKRTFVKTFERFKRISQNVSF